VPGALHGAAAVRAGIAGPRTWGRETARAPGVVGWRRRRSESPARPGGRRRRTVRRASGRWSRRAIAHWEFRVGVEPLGLEFIRASLRARPAGGAPYCSATEVAMVNMASTPRSAERLLADVVDERLAQRVVVVGVGGQVALEPGDRELVRDTGPRRWRQERVPDRPVGPQRRRKWPCRCNGWIIPVPFLITKRTYSPASTATGSASGWLAHVPIGRRAP